MSAPGLFKFPKQRHTRNQSPPQFKKYRDYRPYLNSEFANTCVYCRRPNLTGESRGFEIDHYFPKHQFPALVSDYSNLYLACSTCNGRKSDAYPSRPESPAVPNPCDHVMFEQLRYQNDVATPHSRNGEYAIHLLQLNEPLTLDARKTFRIQANAVRYQLEKLESEIVELRELAESGNSEAEAEVFVMEGQIDKLRKLQLRFDGGG